MGLDKKTTRFIINALREASIKAPNRNEALRRARVRRVTGVTKEGVGKWKWVFVCNKCKKLHEIENVEVDHIEEIGSFEAMGRSLDVFAERLFCPVDNLQVLCVRCHKKKTSANASLRGERKRYRKDR